VWRSSSSVSATSAARRPPRACCARSPRARRPSFPSRWTRPARPGITSANPPTRARARPPPAAGMTSRRCARASWSRATSSASIWLWRWIARTCGCCAGARRRPRTSGCGCCSSLLRRRARRMFRTLTTAGPTASRRCSISSRRPHEACSHTCASAAARPEVYSSVPRSGLFSGGADDHTT